jgi:hypothetical protein
MNAREITSTRPKENTTVGKQKSRKKTDYGIAQQEVQAPNHTKGKQR